MDKVYILTNNTKWVSYLIKNGALLTVNALSKTNENRKIQKFWKDRNLIHQHIVKKIKKLTSIYTYHKNS